MKKGKVLYRVGILDGSPSIRQPLYLGEYTAPNDWETFVKRGSALTFSGPLMSSWVQVLSSRYPCVIVERVEVGHA